MPILRLLFWLFLVGAAWLFRLSYIGWLGPWILSVVIVLPLIILALSLPSMLALDIQLQAPDYALRARDAYFSVLFSNPRLMPVHSVVLHLQLINRYTGEKWKQNFIFRNLETSRCELPLPTQFCGTINCSILSCDIRDAFGLFSIRRKFKSDCSCAVLPDAVPSDESVNFEAALSTSHVLKPKYGGGFAEEHELRGYRPGDLPNSIHWKLSSKMDDLIVREALVPENSTIYVVLVQAGENDRGLEVLRWLSHELIMLEEPHVIVADTLYPVGNDEETDAALASLLSWPLRDPCGYNAKQARCVFLISGREVRVE